MRVYVGRSAEGSKARIAGLDDPAKTKHVLWGDWLDVEDHPGDPAKFTVNWRVLNSATNKIEIERYEIGRSATQTEPLLEMIFVDVGQGDGCIVTVPGKPGERLRILIIDAGQHSNMYRFLRWRFRWLNEPVALHAAVITHPDQDHYLGFQRLFNDTRVEFEHVYHNGLVERVAAADIDILGERKDGFCVEVFETRAALETFLAAPLVRGKKNYPKLLMTALERFADVRMASSAHGETGTDGLSYLPGFAPDGDAPAIRLLGPVPETRGGKTALRSFRKSGPATGTGIDVGITKNGHSVLLKLDYRNLRVIFGGDLNSASEAYLLRHYSGVGADRPLAETVPGASAVFGADLLKCCHHGSADVTDEFLDAVNPLAFVVSSGDEESHVHPRPEILGLLGKKGRGARPMILCTEILRSTPEALRLTDQQTALLKALEATALTAASDAERKAAQKAVRDFWSERTRRLVGVYGAITIRSDGRHLLVAFRKEKPNAGGPWQVYDYAFDDAAAEWRQQIRSGH